MGLPYTVDRYMRQNGNRFWSVAWLSYTDVDRGTTFPPRVGGRYPYQCDIYPETFSSGEVAEIIELTIASREGKDRSVEAHKDFLRRARLARKE